MDQVCDQAPSGEQQAVRQVSGRFVKGISGNPAGRPVREGPPVITKAEARAMAAALYPSAWEGWQAAIEERQSWAIQMAVQYELGKPTERHEVSGADGGPIEHVVRDTRQTIDAFIAEWREVPAEGESNGG